jgi:hypothetical protein
VEVVIPAGEYLFDRAGFVDQVHIDGIRFRGGAGALRLSNTGQNVARGVRITRCEFLDYTQCAIGNNSSDHPYLLVQDCRFHCAAGATAIGIAWGGYADCSVIERNAFLCNSYHLKIGPRLSGNIAIHKNDFILFDTHDRHADIWIVPNADQGGWGQNSGFASSICFNKFGNENLRGLGRRILLAEEDGSSGADRLTRRHKEGMARTGFVSGLTIAHNRISGADHLTGSFLHSFVPKFRYLTWYGNSMDGTAYRYIIEQAGGEQMPAADLAWNIQVDDADGPSVPRTFTNIPSVRVRPGQA